MPIINLTVKGKQAIGDGTKIVCMNADYVVKITLLDCDDFKGFNVKKLVVKQGWEYKEATILERIENNVTVYTAVMPMITSHTDVDIGICGKDSDEAEPKFTSKPARFECDKSVLCGAVVLKEDPKLGNITIESNGIYKAVDSGFDGFAEVDARVTAKLEEEQNVTLSMAGGSQIVTPTSTDRTMSKVMIIKPSSLIPENIKDGVNIGGVRGTYGKTIGTTIVRDGVYTPGDGYSGFSQVHVKVGESNFHRTMHPGDSFTYEPSNAVYTVNASVSEPGIVRCQVVNNILTITAEQLGECTVTVEERASAGESTAVVATRYYNIEVVTASALPVEVYSASDMSKYLKEGEIGSVLKYIGPSFDGFVTGALYIIEEAE